MYTHHTRMFPKRDDVYRAEFPAGPYYSTSSVYSYSPTSASDCPEHGRSRRKITVILTTSIVLATLGVLSIAGVAAYLGILSKNISNNASQSMEESYLLSDSSRNNIGGFTTTEENEYIFTTNDDNGGLDALDGVPGDSLVDLSNALGKGSRSSTPRTTPRVPHSSSSSHSYLEASSSSSSPTRTIEGHYGNVDRVMSSTVQNDDMLLANLVTVRPSHHPHDEENSVRFFTEEASNSATKGPPTHKRNRQRYPLTNSHSLSPSTTTMFTTDRVEDDDEMELEKNDSVIHISHPENAKNPEKSSSVTTTPSSTGESSTSSRTPGNILTLSKLNDSTLSHRDGLPVPPATVSTGSSNFKDGVPTTSTNIVTANRGNSGNGGGESDLDHHHRRKNEKKHQKQSSTEPSQPISKLSDKDRAQQPKNDEENMTSFNEEDARHVDDDDDAHAQDNDHRRHDQIHQMDKLSSNGESEDDSDQGARPNHNIMNPLSQEMFKPIHPIISSERDNSDQSMALLDNHKMPLSFDRISPEYYDTQPWTPLLNRPNLDKRPRVDIDNGHLSSTEPVIVWNSEEPEESHEYRQPAVNLTVSPGMDVVYGQGANFTVGTYYGYGHTGPTSSSEEGNTDRPSSAPPKLRPGYSDHIPFPEENEKLTRNDNGSMFQNPVLPNGESANGFKPSNIPAYTILIPHIPNPNGANNNSVVLGTTTVSSRESDDDFLPPLSGPELDYTNTYKMDRMGVAAEGDEDHRTPNVNKEKPKKKEQKLRGDDKIVTYNFEAIKTLPVPEEAESLKDDEYMDMEDLDEFTEAVQGEPKIYRLDPDSIDMVPDTLGNAKPHYPSSRATSTTHATTSNTPKTEGTERSNTELSSTSYDDDSYEQKQSEMKRNVTVKGSTKGASNKTTDLDKDFSPASMELVIGPQEPDMLIKSTTDLIMSTLGSLNLIKSPAKQHQQQQEPSSEEVEEKLRNSDVASISSGSEEGNKTTESPLFPPVRSYVGVNQPLRPKPSKAETANPMKQFRYEGSILPSFPPDLATTASLQKVLSMMLGSDGMLNEKSRHLASHPLIKGLLNRENVTLILSNDTNGSETVINLDDVVPTVMPTNRQTPSTEYDDSSVVPTPTTPSSGSHREMKAYGSHRDSKIDTAQFTTAADVEHVPVPLIMTESPMQADQPQPEDIKPSNMSHLTPFPWSSRPPKQSTKVQHQSPVYKFHLKKGQSVEDLLKEIFLNYTEINEAASDSTVFRDSSSEMSKVPIKLGILAGAGTGIASGIPGFKSLEDMNVEETSNQTANASSSAPVRISHHVETTPLAFNPVPTMPSSVESTDEVHTQTSIVVNEEMDMTNFDCPTNDTFRCVSSGKCIPSYLRCNFIKECEDNSDEEGCLCADFLRANGNARKLCDGIPDCADASDEYQDCEYCQPGQYICAGSRSCINKDQICDAKRDCQYGDDESDCVKIGHNEIATLKEDFAPTYHRRGHLMVRKTGNWGKLCVESFSSVVSHWEVKDLARAICKALTFSDYETVETIKDPTPNSTEPYYELHYGSPNQTQSSGEAHQRPGLGFRETECNSKQVVNVTCQNLQCGVAPRAYTQRARIVGGANSLPGKWPWQAALYKNGEYQCGATLISSRWLLSAGHCFYHAQDDHWVARLGTLRRGATVLSPYEQVVRITHIFLHPEYKDVGFINDVSLLRLEKEVNFTDFVRPVCLPGKESKIRDGRMCTVVGWGQLFEVGRVFPDTLQEVQLPLISTSECRKRTLFLPLYKLTDQMFCAGFDRGGRDACLGDSGGPLMCPESDGRWSLYGVTSNGYGCARANRPGVYTKVTSYLDWIYEKMSQDSAFTYRDKSKPCAGHRCLLGECLEKRQVCNGIRDCVEDDGSDERGPNCTTYLT